MHKRKSCLLILVGVNKINRWTKLSIEFANQRNYLDELFSVYPTIPEGIRDIDKNLWNSVEKPLMMQSPQLNLMLMLKRLLF